MLSQKGFTLIEILVVLFIIGLAATFALPNFTGSVEQMKSQTAKNNLLAISAAQEKYNEDYGIYCTAVGCGDTSANLSVKLLLSLGGAEDPFTYTCFAQAGDLYRCTAVDNVLTLTMDVTTANGAVVSCNLGNDSRCPN